LRIPVFGSPLGFVSFAKESEEMGKDAKFVVRLESDERRQLQAMVDEGRGAKSVRQRARILLKSDESDEGPAWADLRTAEFAEVSLSTVHRVRQRFVEEGLEAAVFRKPANRRYRKLDGAAEARLIAEACGRPPNGRARWTLKLLGERLVELEIVESISPATVYRTLKKTNSSHGRSNSG
jgi:transposase